MKPAFIILVFLISSCQSGNTDLLEKNTYQIVSLLIDEFGTPTIPPREIYGLKPFTKIQIDSIKNRKQKIALYPKLQSSDEEFVYNDDFDKEFNKLVSMLKHIKDSKAIDLTKIKIDRPYQLSFIDTVAMKNDRRYIEKNFDKSLYFSRISFNQDYTKAVLIVGVSMGPLNGYGSLVFLENTNNTWKIKGADTFSIS